MLWLPGVTSLRRLKATEDEATLFTASYTRSYDVLLISTWTAVCECWRAAVCPLLKLLFSTLRGYIHSTMNLLTSISNQTYLNISKYFLPWLAMNQSGPISACTHCVFLGVEQALTQYSSSLCFLLALSGRSWNFPPRLTPSS